MQRAVHFSIVAQLIAEKNVFNIHKEGGTGEALKLKLHLNSEVYKRGNFNDFG